MPTIRDRLLHFLSDRSVKHGESVEFGWFTFWTQLEGATLSLKTLDFESMASFTGDFTEVERIHKQQLSILD